VPRLMALAVCAAISHATYRASHHMPLAQHTNVLAVLGIWAAVSALCQWGLKHERWANAMRWTWAGADTVLLTAVLRLADAWHGPLIALYPVLIVLSGLWLRPALIGTTTVLAMLGYLFLLWDTTSVSPGVHRHWDAIFMVGLAITGLTVAYLINRVRVLNRFYEGQPRA
jgi:hypothetical protein